jgi:hypothetical protein
MAKKNKKHAADKIEEAEVMEQPEAQADDTEREDEQIEENQEEAEDTKQELVHEKSETPDDEPKIDETKPDEAPKTKPSFVHKVKKLLKTRKGKIIAAVAAAIVIIGLIVAIPASRYGITGIFVKKNLTISVVDASTGKPVSQADVTIAGKSTNTSNKGIATFSKIPVGDYAVNVTKKYYKNSAVSYTVPIFGNAKQPRVSFIATGRQVIVTVVNKITQKPVEKALIKVGDTSAETDASGVATIVLPVGKPTLTGSITTSKYNDTNITVSVTDSTMANKFAVTPAGKIFYLSKITGTINVMSSNLDGSDTKVIVAGTGNESDTATTLLASTDWKYLALDAQRDTTDNAQLYLIDTTSGQLKLMDKGNATFSQIGWMGHKFLYKVARDISNYVNGQQVLKSYDADSTKLTTIDQTLGSGSSYYDYQYQDIGNEYIFGDKLVYTKVWALGSEYFYSNSISDKQSAIVSINGDGSDEQVLKQFKMGHSTEIDAKPYEPGAAEYQVDIDANNPQYFEYEDGSVKTDSTFTTNQFDNNGYPTYLISPSGNKSFWYEPRDGKNTLLVGDDDAQNKTTLGALSDFSTYGWYSDDYVLLSKNGSELYIASATQPLDKVAPLKITDYHKPSQSFLGYGSGYGGI